MKKPAFDQKLLIRSTGRAKLGLDRVVAAMRADPRARWFGGRVTQEAVVSASWLWMEELDPEVVREAIGRHLPRLEALLKGLPDPGSGPAEGLAPQEERARAVYPPEPQKRRKSG